MTRSTRCLLQVSPASRRSRKDPWGAVNAVTGGEQCPNEPKQPRVLLRSVRERLLHPSRLAGQANGCPAMDPPSARREGAAADIETLNSENYGPCNSWRKSPSPAHEGTELTCCHWPPPPNHRRDAAPQRRGLKPRYEVVLTASVSGSAASSSTSRHRTTCRSTSRYRSPVSGHVMIPLASGVGSLTP